VGSEALLERIVAAIGFPLQLLRSDLKIFNKWLPFGFMMVDDDLQFGIDLERCAATRTFHFEQGARGRHIGIVAQRKAEIGPALSFDCRNGFGIPLARAIRVSWIVHPADVRHSGFARAG